MIVHKKDARTNILGFLILAIKKDIITESIRDSTSLCWSSGNIIWL
jgi:hypothetical protein